MKYRTKLINAACILLCLLIGYQTLCEIIQTDTVGSSLQEWMPGVKNLGPLAPEEFFNYDESIFLLSGGKSGQRNEVEIGRLDEPEAVGKVGVDLTYQDERYALALELMKEGKLQEAEIVLRSYLDEKPLHADAWRQLGDCEYNLDKVHEALSAYRNALKYEPENYLALRGQGVASLYLGYQCYDFNNTDKAHEFFQVSLSTFHTCLEFRDQDKLAAYGQSLAAEGVSRQLYMIAREALGTENHDQAKRIIRNCMDIIDTAIAATEKRIESKPEDIEAKLLLSTLLVRRARILQPFGHIEEASGNLDEAVKIIEPIARSSLEQRVVAENQIALCVGLKELWKTK